MSEYATKDDVQSIVNKAVDDLSEVISIFAAQVDNRFNELEDKVDKLQTDVSSILNRLDSIKKRYCIERR